MSFLGSRSKIVIAIFIALWAAYYAYNVVGVAVSADRRGMPVWSALTKAEACEQQPTSQCFAELAVLSLKPHQSLRGVGGVDLELRYVGYGDFADEATKPADRRWIKSNQISQMLYESVSADSEQFIATHPTEDVHAYMAAYAFLQGDTSYFSAVFPVGTAVAAARSRLGAPFSNDQTAALMRKWRQSLDKHARYSREWLNYATRARELKQVEQAKEALALAEEIGLTDTARGQAVVERWRLFGADAVVQRIEEFSDTNTRAEAYLKISDLAAKSGDNEWSIEMFANFQDNYDREKPIRHRVVWLHMASRAARVAHALGKEERAEFWAEVYAKETSFYRRAERVRYSGRLYANVGLFDRAIVVAREAIADAPTPENLLWPMLPGRKSSREETLHNSTVGHAIGIYCLAGEFDTAFELAARNPSYGVTASAGCLAAVVAEKTTLTLAEIERQLGSASRRPLRTGYAATLVERGNYQQAAKLIASTIDLPPQFGSVPRVFANVQLLRLAVAMRDEPLTRKIMQHIVGDAGKVSGGLAVNVFASVAAHTKAWPDEDDSDRDN